MSYQKNNELSDRELSILKLVATGASNKEIAQKLFISLNTVKVHLRNIFGKIGVASRTEAAMYAVRIGLVETVAREVLTTEGALEDKDLETSDTQPATGSTTPQSSLSKLKENRSFRFISIFGGVVLLLVFVLLLDSGRNIFQSITPTAVPTATPRVQWFELPGLPTPRWGLASANYENQIYAIAGENASGPSNLVEKFDPQSSQWSELSPKPTPVSDVNAAVIGGLIYVPGGKLASGDPTNINEIYDPLTDQWSTGSPLPIPLSAYALTVYEGQMYIFGGWNGKQALNNAFVYDPKSDSWSEIVSMPTARTFAAAVVVGGKIYVIGGWDGNQALSTNEVYLPDHADTSPAWSSAPALPTGRYAMGLANIADIIFVIGGAGDEENLSVIALSSGDTTWGQLQSPILNNWEYLSAVPVGTRLYALGGKISDTPVDVAWSYQVIFTISFPIIR